MWLYKNCTNFSKYTTKFLYLIKILGKNQKVIYNKNYIYRNKIEDK